MKARRKRKIIRKTTQKTKTSSPLPAQREGCESKIEHTLESAKTEPSIKSCDIDINNNKKILGGFNDLELPPKKRKISLEAIENAQTETAATCGTAPPSENAQIGTAATCGPPLPSGNAQTETAATYGTAPPSGNAQTETAATCGPPPPSGNAQTETAATCGPPPPSGNAQTETAATRGPPPPSGNAQTETVATCGPPPPSKCCHDHSECSCTDRYPAIGTSTAVESTENTPIPNNLPENAANSLELVNNSDGCNDLPEVVILSNPETDTDEDLALNEALNVDFSLTKMGTSQSQDLSLLPVPLSRIKAEMMIWGTVECPIVLGDDVEDNKPDIKNSKDIEVITLDSDEEPTKSEPPDETIVREPRSESSGTPKCSAVDSKDVKVDDIPLPSTSSFHQQTNLSSPPNASGGNASISVSALVRKALDDSTATSAKRAFESKGTQVGVVPIPSISHKDDQEEKSGNSSSPPRGCDKPGHMEPCNHPPVTCCSVSMHPYQAPEIWIPHCGCHFFRPKTYLSHPNYCPARHPYQRRKMNAVAFNGLQRCGDIDHRQLCCDDCRGNYHGRYYSRHSRLSCHQRKRTSSHPARRDRQRTNLLSIAYDKKDQEAKKTPVASRPECPHRSFSQSNSTSPQQVDSTQLSSGVITSSFKSIHGTPLKLVDSCSTQTVSSPPPPPPLEVDKPPKSPFSHGCKHEERETEIGVKKTSYVSPPPLSGVPNQTIGFYSSADMRTPEDPDDHKIKACFLDEKHFKHPTNLKVDCVEQNETPIVPLPASTHSKVDFVEQKDVFPPLSYGSIRSQKKPSSSTHSVLPAQANSQASMARPKITPPGPVQTNSQADCDNSDMTSDFSKLASNKRDLLALLTSFAKDERTFLNQTLESYSPLPERNNLQGSALDTQHNENSQPDNESLNGTSGALVQYSQLNEFVSPAHSFLNKISGGSEPPSLVLITPSQGLGPGAPSQADGQQPKMIILEIKTIYVPLKVLAGVDFSNSSLLGEGYSVISVDPNDLVRIGESTYIHRVLALTHSSSSAQGHCIAYRLLPDSSKAPSSNGPSIINAQLSNTYQTVILPLGGKVSGDEQIPPKKNATSPSDGNSDVANESLSMADAQIFMSANSAQSLKNLDDFGAPIERGRASSALAQYYSDLAKEIGSDDDTSLEMETEEILFRSQIYLAPQMRYDPGPGDFEFTNPQNSSSFSTSPVSWSYDPNAKQAEQQFDDKIVNNSPRGVIVCKSSCDTTSANTEADLN